MVFIPPRFHQDWWFQTLPLRRYRCGSGSPAGSSGHAAAVCTQQLLFSSTRKQALTTFFILKTPILNSLLMLEQMKHMFPDDNLCGCRGASNLWRWRQLQSSPVQQSQEQKTNSSSQAFQNNSFLKFLLDTRVN